MKQAPEKNNVRSAPRNEYKRPILVEFGPVGALTQTGTMGPGELVSGGMGMSTPMCFMDQPPPPTTGFC